MMGRGVTSASDIVKFITTWDDLPECSKEMFRQRGIHWFWMEFELPRHVIEDERRLRGWVRHYSIIRRLEVTTPLRLETRKLQGRGGDG